jgi:hypothetical protein
VKVLSFIFSRIHEERGARICEHAEEICIITFSGALLHVSAPGSHHQAKYNKPIANY